MRRNWSTVVCCQRPKFWVAFGVSGQSPIRGLPQMVLRRGGMRLSPRFAARPCSRTMRGSESVASSDGDVVFPTDEEPRDQAVSGPQDPLHITPIGANPRTFRVSAARLSTGKKSPSRLSSFPPRARAQIFKFVCRSCCCSAQVPCRW